MSVAPEYALQFSPMRYEDIERVSSIERVLYEFPWTAGNFRDSMNAGYSCWTCYLEHDLAGYAVLIVAAGEAHLLNISIAERWQGRGLGNAMLNFLLDLARERHCDRIFLEVRRSNASARRLYQRNAFVQIGLRKAYYPAAIGREDALVFEREL